MNNYKLANLVYRSVIGNLTVKVGANLLGQDILLKTRVMRVIYKDKVTKEERFTNQYFTN